MKHKYVIGFLSFFDNEMKMEIIKADNPVQALRSCSFVGDYEFPDDATVEDIERIMFDCDSAIGIIEV